MPNSLTVTVRAGKVTRVIPTGTQGAGTVENMFASIASAIDSVRMTACFTQATYDARDGHPTGLAYAEQGGAADGIGGFDVLTFMPRR
ncbi:hypothetical protein [Deinococcus sp.]|uniref:hypothetical protein n=1 Tax=Deinococcus sp. TaxID=47478 RepID=UPI002869B2B3|nr:hypothetical protein [Deinococcus sp.]